MTIIYGVAAFVFGTIVGSFLNVVALRHNTGMSKIIGRSKCFSCGKKLSWYEMVPVASYIFLTGKCSKCKSRVSLQYPIVELSTGVIFTLALMRSGSELLTVYGFLDAVLILAIVSVLSVIVVYDIKHKIISDSFVTIFALLSIAHSLIAYLNGGSLSFFLWAIAAGPILALPFFLLWLLSGGRWMGLGDAKLALGIGWFLGLWAGIAAVVLAFWSGAIYSVTALFLEKVGVGRLLAAPKNLTMKSEIPFAPFLVLGTALSFFAGINFFSLMSFFQIYGL